MAGGLPEQERETLPALRLLIDAPPTLRATRSAGPRFFHFVMEAHPAALGADRLTSAPDQIALLRSSLFAMSMEQVVVSPRPSASYAERRLDDGRNEEANCPSRGGAPTVGSTQRRRRQAGGKTPRRRCPFSPAHRARQLRLKALAMLGVGRRQVRTALSMARADRHRRDEAELRERRALAILLATAGEPNAGAFDPIDEMAELARRYSAWLHGWRVRCVRRRFPATRDSRSAGWIGLIPSPST